MPTVGIPTDCFICTLLSEFLHPFSCPRMRTCYISIFGIATFFFSLPVRALLVLSPSDSQGWTIGGLNQLQWSRVNTDPESFAVTLTNTDTSILPVNQKVTLLNNVNTSTLSQLVSLPSNSKPGTSYRANLVSVTNGEILAQSSEFTIDIAQPTTSSHLSFAILETSKSAIQASTSTKTTATTEITSTSAASSSPIILSPDRNTAFSLTSTSNGVLSSDSSEATQIAATTTITASTARSYDVFLIEYGIELTGFELDLSIPNATTFRWRT